MFLFPLVLLTFIITFKSISIRCANSREFTVQEECPINTPLTDVTRYIKQENPLRRHFTLVGKYKHLFELHPESAELVVKQRIDRETLCPAEENIERLGMRNNLASEVGSCMLDFSVLADHVSPTAFHLVIQDINDDTPHWQNEFVSLEFNENTDVGRDFLNEYRQLDTAVDRDSLPNSRITYRLEETEFLGQFHKTSQRRPIPFILTQPALKEGGLKLQQVSSLDREKREVYNFTILAIDSGHPPLTGSLLVIVLVKDINDHSPNFNSSLYQRIQPLSEAAPIGSEVLRVFAKDDDAGEHGKVNYFILSQGPSALALKYFSLDRQSGILRVNNKLDYDNSAKRHFRFTILAVDSAPEPYSKTGTAQVEINLSDENDEKPVIELSFIQSDPLTKVPFIMENNLVPHVVAYAYVSDLDKDGNDRVTCQVINNHNFSINSEGMRQKVREWKLIAEASFDRESTPWQKLDILCTDEASSQSIVKTHVRILDQNDETPKFPSLLQFLLPENKPPNSVTFGKVKAIDADEGINAELTYEICLSDKTGRENFHVHPKTGELQALKYFDRETSEMEKFCVSATDHGSPPRTGTGQVQVKITDDNDNSPRLTQPHYTFMVSENCPTNCFVGRIQATDADIGKNGQILYVLPSTVESTAIEHSPKYLPQLGVTFFSLDRRTGEIRTKRELDREIQSVYTITILAYDEATYEETISKNPTELVSSELVRNDRAQVTILVMDVNEFSPTFVSPDGTEEIFSIDKNDPQGKPILTANATDRDEGENAAIHYFIAEGNVDYLFQIDERSGTLFLSRTIQAARHSLYQLQLRACDGGKPNPLCTLSNSIRISVQSDLAGSRSKESPWIGEQNPANSGMEPIIATLVLVFIALLAGIIGLIYVVHRRSTAMRSKSSTVERENWHGTNQGQAFSNRQFTSPETIMDKQDTNVIYEERMGQSRISLVSKTLTPHPDMHTHVPRIPYDSYDRQGAHGQSLDDPSGQYQMYQTNYYGSKRAWQPPGSVMDTDGKRMASAGSQPYLYEVGLVSKPVEDMAPGGPLYHQYYEIGTNQRPNHYHVSRMNQPNLSRGCEEESQGQAAGEMVPFSRNFVFTPIKENESDAGMSQDKDEAFYFSGQPGPNPGLSYPNRSHTPNSLADDYMIRGTTVMKPLLTSDSNSKSNPYTINSGGFRTVERAPTTASKLASDAYNEASFV